MQEPANSVSHVNSR